MFSTELCTVHCTLYLTLLDSLYYIRILSSGRYLARVPNSTRKRHQRWLLTNALHSLWSKPLPHPRQRYCSPCTSLRSKAIAKGLCAVWGLLQIGSGRTTSKRSNALPPMKKTMNQRLFLWKSANANGLCSEAVKGNPELNGPAHSIQALCTVWMFVICVNGFMSQSDKPIGHSSYST